ncbi:hypothetical protein N7490_003851 [Penicillium lividum]|nr:hypothetical protein N7490_003851 [Penicillium lividum]
MAVSPAPDKREMEDDELRGTKVRQQREHPWTGVKGGGTLGDSSANATSASACMARVGNGETAWKMSKDGGR